jgi:hypothetical protein
LSVIPHRVRAQNVFIDLGAPAGASWEQDSSIRMVGAAETSSFFQDTSSMSICMMRALGSTAHR